MRREWKKRWKLQEIVTLCRWRGSTLNNLIESRMRSFRHILFISQGTVHADLRAGMAIVYERLPSAQLTFSFLSCSRGGAHEPHPRER